MVQINFARKEINCKIVYYGPGLSGKTTSLEVVHQRTPQGHKGELTSISTDGDRTLFFDFMPLDLGTIAGMKVKFHLYTVPGQVYYNSTRKLVLLGADGIIFVADSTPGRMDDNQQSMDNLRENLTEMGRDLNKIPLVIQYNKRDLPNPISLAELEGKLNPNKVPTFETSAKTGEGIFQALKAISALVLEDINSSDKKGSVGAGARKPAAAPAAGAAPARAPVAVSRGNEGVMPQKEPGSVLRPSGRPALAPAASAPAASVAARDPAPAREHQRERERESSAAVAEAPPRPAAPVRQTMSKSKSALQHQVRQVQQQQSRREEPEAAAPAPTPVQPKSSGGSVKMVFFMVLGVLAGAAAAVAAVKLLFKF
jgi:signal recognition particle receptor subunit beta